MPKNKDYILSEIFGDCPQVKIIETFAANYNDKLYIADIARTTGLNKVTITKHIKKLLKEGIIKKAGKAGIVQYYQLDCKNEKAKIVLLLERVIVAEKLKEKIGDDKE